MSVVIAKLAAAGIGTYYVRYYVLYGVVLAVLVVIALLWRHRLPGWVRLTVLGIAGIAVIRLAFFDNPIALRFYRRYVPSEAVGLRQSAVLDVDIAKYARNI